MSLGPSSGTSPKIALFLIACGQAVMGLIVGAVTSFTLIAADPLEVTAFRLPQGVDSVKVQAAFDEWKSSTRVVIGSAAMTLIPLLVSGLCGVFAHKSLPSSIPTALLRMTGVALLLLLLSTVGTEAIDHALSTGESSDIQTPLAMLAFEFLCIALAAPLSSIVTRRRASQGRALAEAEGQTPGTRDSLARAES